MKVKKKSEVFTRSLRWIWLPTGMLMVACCIFLVFRISGHSVWALIGIFWVALSLLFAPLYLMIWLQGRWLQARHLPAGFGRWVLLHYLLLSGLVWWGNRFQNREYITVENHSEEVIEELRFSCNGSEKELRNLKPGQTKTSFLQPGYHDQLLLTVEVRTNWQVRSLLLKEEGEGRVWPCTVSIHSGLRLVDRRASHGSGEVRRVGKSGDPLVVLLQGYAYLPNRWDAVLPVLLQEGYQVLEVRPPGTTAAEPPVQMDQVAPRKQAAWLHDYIEAMEAFPSYLIADQSAEPVVLELQQDCPGYWPKIFMVESEKQWRNPSFSNSSLFSKLLAWWHGSKGFGNGSQASYAYLFFAFSNLREAKEPGAWPRLTLEAIINRLQADKSPKN